MSPPDRGLVLHVEICLLDQFPAATETATTSSESTAAISERLVDGIAVVIGAGAGGTVRSPSAASERGQLWRGAAATTLFESLQSLGADRRSPLTTADDVAFAGASTWVTARGDEPFDALFDGGDAFRHDPSQPSIVARVVAVAVTGRPDGRADVAIEHGTRGFGAELLKLAAPLTVDGEPLLVIVPSPFRGSRAAAVAAWLHIAPPPIELPAARDHDDRLAAARASVLARRVGFGSGGDPGSGAGPGPDATTEQSNTPPSARLLAWRSLPSDVSGRAALVWLTAAQPDGLASDLSLVAADDDLTAYLARLAAARGATSTAGSSAAIAAPTSATNSTPATATSAIATPPAASPITDAAIDALLEREAWSFLAAKAMNGDLPPELQSVALRRAGAAGAFPTTLEEVARSASDAEAIARRLIDENRLLLEDSSATTRVRAFDWLRARAAAPPDYDPLAALAARRKALAAAEATRE